MQNKNNIFILSCNTVRLEENFKLHKVIPSFIHYLPKDKNEFYEKYIPALDDYIKRNVRT